MEYLIGIVFLGCVIGYTIYRRKTQLRLLNEVKNSHLMQDLLELGYKETENKKNELTGIHKRYQTGFYYHEDNRKDLIGYAWINCDIPYVKSKGGVKKMMAFSKMYSSLGLAIDSKTGFGKELNVNFLLNSSKGEIFKLFDEMVFVATKEGFNPIN